MGIPAEEYDNIMGDFTGTKVLPGSIVYSASTYCGEPIMIVES